MGWERPLVFGPPGLDYTWGKPAWLDASAAEHRACRTGVAVFDQTSFSTYVVAGPDALAGLQWVCAADVDVPVGGCVYTPFLNARGTYEADLTVTRTGAEEFLVVSSSATTIRDLDWIGRHAGVVPSDLTDDLSVLGVMGPGARDLLAPLTDADLTDERFPFATSREIDVAGVRLRATRMTYVGELGWELMVPLAGAPDVHEALVEARGGERGVLRDRVVAAGEGVPRVRPRADARLDAGRGRAGLRHRAQGRQGLPRPRRPGAATGGRAAAPGGLVRARRPGADGVGRRAAGARRRPLGQVTSAAWGATVGASVGLASLRIDDWPVTAADLARGGFEVDVAGTRHRATVTLKAPLA